MIDEHRVLILDKIEGGHVEFEVNFNADPSVQGCKVIKVKDGKETYFIKRDDLLTLMLIMGDAKTQKALLPIQTRRVRHLERMLHGSFEATKNYQKGDRIHYSFPWVDEIPVDDEVLAGNIGKLTEQMKAAKPKIFK